MATVIETVEKDGLTVLVYDNGMERNAVTKKLLRPPSHALITRENANVYQRKRQEKAAAALRARILAATQKRSDVQLTGAADAVAEAGGILWDEIVMADPETAGVYPRDRLEAWEKIGKYAGVLPADVRQPAEPNVTNNTIIINGSDAIAKAWKDALTIQPADTQIHETIDGVAEDV